MRGLWICQRRLRPSLFGLLVLLFGTGLLTFVTIHRDKYVVLDNEAKSHQNAIGPKIVFSEHVPGRWGLFSDELIRHGLNHHFTVHENYATVDENNVMQVTQDYNQNNERAPREIYIAKQTPKALPNSSEHKFIKIHSKIKSDKSLDASLTFHQNNKPKLDKFKSLFLELMDSTKSPFQREVVSNLLIQLSDPAPSSELLLRLLSHIPQRDSSLFVRALDSLLEGRTTTDSLRSQYIDSLKQIIARISNQLLQTTYSDNNVAGNGKMYIPNDKSINSPINVNDSFSRIQENYTNTVSLNVRNTSFSTEHSGFINVTELGFNSNTSATRFLSKAPHAKRMLRSWVRNNPRSMLQRKDNPQTFTRVVDGIYWSDEVEDNIPNGISSQAADEWIAKSRVMGFKVLQSASWQKCGRPKNAFALLIDGNQACVRYRSPHDRLVQGEILSYWLARLLGLDNVPPVYLSSLNSSQWAGQKHRFPELGWAPEDYVATIMWITDIDSRPEAHVLMPRRMLEAYRQKWAINGSTWNNHGSTALDIDKGTRDRQLSLNRTGEVIMLAQWGSMIIFDYLTGNYDRVASMQDGAEKEKKPSIIEESIRNLRRSKSRNKLWLTDNESGFLDSYEMMYQRPEFGKRFVRFHDKMLQTMCIFQRRVVESLRELYQERNAHKALEKYSLEHETLLKFIEKESSYKLFEKYFSKRLEAVIKWINYCERKTR